MGFFTALKTVTTIVSTVSAFKQGQAQNKQAEADMSASYQAGSFDLSLLQNQLEELISGTDVEVYDRQRQGAKDRAKILASAGEASLAGNTLMRTLASSMLDENRDLGIYETNLENQKSQVALEAHKTRTQASTNASYASSKRTNPFLNSLAVGIPGALDTYNIYKQEQLRD